MPSPKWLPLMTHAVGDHGIEHSRGDGGDGDVDDVAFTCRIIHEFIHPPMIHRIDRIIKALKAETPLRNCEQVAELAVPRSIAGACEQGNAVSIASTQTCNAKVGAEGGLAIRRKARTGRIQAKSMENEHAATTEGSMLDVKVEGPPAYLS